MSDMSHLLIPFASCSAKGSRDAVAALELPHLRELLSLLTLDHSDTGDEYTLSPPHERALARALGLAGADGCIPWAAWQVQRSGGEAGHIAWAFITPCHWQVHSDHITMSDPQALQLHEADSRAFMAAMQPYFSEDGITLHYEQPGRWLAHSEVFRGLPCASLDRVTGRNIDAWMPEAAQAAPLRRLQNEMQMLLYMHAVNDERGERGLAPVNSFWVSGAGALDSRAAPDAQAASDATHLRSSKTDGIEAIARLREPALHEDWASWAQAWQALDANECKALLDTLKRTGCATLTLCGERNAQTFNAAPRSFVRRIAGLFGSHQPSVVLHQL